MTRFWLIPLLLTILFGSFAFYLQSEAEINRKDFQRFIENPTANFSTSNQDSISALSLNRIIINSVSLNAKYGLEENGNKLLLSFQSLSDSKLTWSILLEKVDDKFELKQLEGIENYNKIVYCDSN